MAGDRVEKGGLAGPGRTGEDDDQRCGGVLDPGDEVLADGADDPIAAGDQSLVVDTVLEWERLK
jgi:hypothetical protein